MRLNPYPTLAILMPSGIFIDLRAFSSAIWASISLISVASLFFWHLFL
jgi:hypothetical protein